MLHSCRLSRAALVSRRGGGQPQRPPPSHRPGAVLSAWLLSRASLTAALTRLAAGDLHVELQRQYRRPLRPAERRLLPQAGRRAVLVRQVRLIGCGQDWVEATSLLPLPALHGWARHLAHIGTRPLGALLFRLRHLQRSEPSVVRTVTGCWHRHSLFRQGRGCPILVGETFLPALLHRLEQETP